MSADRYTYRVTWSAEDRDYVGTCAEFPSLSWLDGDENKAFRGIRRLVRRVVSDLRAEDEAVPEPLSERRFSGKLQVRLPPDLHRRLTVEAAESGVSLNRLISYKLAG
ncbi:MAG: type II toxin-antitoxin system HicB family antitoxin [Rhodospirillales bacterium]|nr:type II toxin-antitoxin system HicB family antitoxin [Rhodospirillales bacterium]